MDINRRVHMFHFLYAPVIVEPAGFMRKPEPSQDYPIGPETTSLLNTGTTTESLLSVAASPLLIPVWVRRATNTCLSGHIGIPGDEGLICRLTYR